MNTVIDLFEGLRSALRCVGQLLWLPAAAFGYLLRFVGALRFVSVFFRTRASLAARLLAAEPSKQVHHPAAIPAEPHGRLLGQSAAPAALPSHTNMPAQTTACANAVSPKFQLFWGVILP